MPYKRAFAKKLGQNVRKRRKRARLTQMALAEKADTGTNYISEIELAKIENVSAFIVYKIAHALGCTVDDLLK